MYLFFLNVINHVYLFIIYVCLFKSFFLSFFLFCIFCPINESLMSIKPGSHCAIFNSLLRLLLVTLYEHDPHVKL